MYQSQVLGLYVACVDRIKPLDCLCLQIKAYEKLECSEERMKQARDIYDNFIMKELLARSHVSRLLSSSRPRYKCDRGEFLTFFFFLIPFLSLQDYSKECLQHVQKHLMKNDVPPTLFEVREEFRWKLCFMSNIIFLHYSLIQKKFIII